MNAGNQFAATRVCAVMATKSTCKPSDPSFEGNWVVHGENGGLALEPVKSMLNTPMNAVITPSVEDGASLLKKVKEDLMPDMSDYSGMSVCVVHSEVVIDVPSGSLMAQVLLFPVGFVSLADVQATQIAQSAMDISDGSDGGQPVPESTGEGTSSESAVIRVVHGGADAGN